MRKITYIFLITMLVNIAHAQSPSLSWAKNMGGGSLNEALAVTTDGSGNVYTIGDYEGITDFDPGAGVFNLTSAGQNDIFISKLDAFGNLVWAKSIGGSSYDKGMAITLDANGNVYATGSYTGTVDFDPGAGISNLSNSTSYYASAFILKLNSDGNFIWATNLYGSPTAYGSSIDIDQAGNVYTAGYFTGGISNSMWGISFSSAGNEDIFVCKIDPSGNFIWAKKIGGLYPDLCNGLSLDINGNAYLTGRFTTTVDFDPGTGVFNLSSSSSSDYDMFVCKLNQSGSFVWAKRIGSVGWDEGYAIDIDPFGNVYTTGTFNGNVDFDPNVGVSNLVSNVPNSSNAFVSKLDALGNYIWAKKLDGNLGVTGKGITTDIYGNVYSIGFFYGLVDFDPNAGVYNLTANGYTDVYVSKLDATGNFIWTYKIGSTESDFGNGISLTGLNYIVTTGQFKLTADFDPGIGVSNLTSNSLHNIFVQEVIQTPCIYSTTPTIASTLSDICNGQSVILSIDTGSLNSAIVWKWYTGSCGGILVGTGNSITVSPTSTTTYYVRGEGGCVLNAACANKTITVNPLPIVTASNVSGCAGSPVSLIGNPAGGIFNVTNPYLGASTTYTYSYTNGFGCSTTSSPATITIYSLPPLSISVTPDDTICTGTSLTFNATGASTYSWTNGTSSPINNVPFIPISSSTYTVTATNSNGCSTTSFIPITITNQTPITISTSRCGSGIVNLGASGTGTLSWYNESTGGSIINTGSTYNPSISSTTSYYVDNTYLANSSNVNSTIGAASNTIGSGGQTTLAQWLLFNVMQTCTLQTVVVYPGAAGNVILEQRNSTGTIVLNTTTMSVTASQIGTAVTMTLNWPLTIGNGYRIYRNTASVPLYRNISGGIYPYSNSSVSITGNSGSSNNYWWAYNWTINTLTNNYCTSTRTPVTATINPLPIVTASNVNGCAGNPISLIGSPASVNGSFNQPNPYSGSSTSYLYFYTDSNGCSGVSSPASITVDTCSLTLNLKLFLQGYYNGSESMQPVLLNEGVIGSNTISDAIIVELHSTVFPFDVIKTNSTFLHTNGIATCTFNVATGEYYVVIKHRNTLATWSATPIVLNTAALTYDFSTASSKAYGNNMKEVESGVWALFTGDLNFDENIDLLDVLLLENDISNFYFGYYSTDLNGDGNVDLVDWPIIENNVKEFISSSHP